MNLNSNVRNTDNLELHRYDQKEMLSLLHKFPFEYVALKHKQLGDYNSKRVFINSVFVHPGIVASLVSVVIVSGIFFF